MIINEPLIRITDFNDPRLDIYTRLPEVQLLRYREPKPGIFLAESPKVIERALLAQCPDVPVYVASAGLLAQMRGFQMTRGMLCAIMLIWFANGNLYVLVQAAVLRNLYSI